MITKVRTAALWGLEGFEVTVEAFFGKGFFEMEIIGLPDLAVKESQNRIGAALSSLSLPVPKGKVTINLAPADRKKQGSGFDLPILIAILSGTVLSGIDLSSSSFFGELSLDGSLRGGVGALPRTIAARDAGAKEIFVPFENEKECSVVDGISVFGVENVFQIIKHFTGEELLSPAVYSETEEEEKFDKIPDFADIKGQEVAKRAIEIAAAGGHNILLVGPPGSGKSMLAKAIPGILPQMTFEEMLSITAIHSVSGLLPPGKALLKNRPFRSPHHTVSFAGLVGGGATPCPGEISLAHNGVLFLDELPEFDKHNLEILRQPLEDGCVTVTRAAWKMTFPSSFMLVCAMNPCPCGFYGDPGHKCTCTPKGVQRYLGKISGPLLDRIDIRVEVPALSFEELQVKEKGEDSKTVRERVNRAREIAKKRYENLGITCNGDLPASKVSVYCTMTSEAREIFKESFSALSLSARGHDRILRLARTIADLEGAEIISESHILEALQYRVSSEKYFS